MDEMAVLFLIVSEFLDLGLVKMDGQYLKVDMDDRMAS